MSLTITWDGNTEGRELIDSNVWGSGVVFYKISDRVLTETNLANATIVFSTGDEWVIDSFRDFGDGIVVGRNRIISGFAGTHHYTDNDYYYITLPSDGTYFAVITDVDDTSFYVARANFPNVPTLRGVWIFNETLSQPIDESPTYDGAVYMSAKVPFVSDSTNHVYMALYGDADDPVVCSYLSFAENWSLGGKKDVYHFYSENNDKALGWQDEAYRTVDFGTEPQEVSAEFYAWFTENATPEFTLTARDLYRKINGKPTKLTLYKKINGELKQIQLNEEEI